MTEDDKRQAIYNAVKALPRLRNIPVKTAQDAQSRAEIFERIFWGLTKIDGILAAAERLLPHWEGLWEDIGRHADSCESLAGVSYEIESMQRTLALRKEGMEAFDRLIERKVTQ